MYNTKSEMFTSALNIILSLKDNKRKKAIKSVSFWKENKIKC